MKPIIFLLLLTSCNWGPFRKDNPKKTVTTTEMLDRIDISLVHSYCPLAVTKFQEADGKIQTCDSALFAGLLGVACPYGVDIGMFEKADSPGQMCRTPDCDCYDPDTETDNGSDSQYSKDMNAGIQLNLSVHLKPVDLIERIVAYLTDHNLVMCEAINEVTWLSKCILPPESMVQWVDLLAKVKGEVPEPEQREKLELTAIDQKGFERHLSVLGVIKEGEIYGGISDISKAKLRTHFAAEPNNLVYWAAYELYNNGDMREVAWQWLETCPLERLPNNHEDWCTDYKFQRDEEGTDWAVCPEREFEEHPGIDCAFAAWLILHNREG